MKLPAKNPHFLIPAGTSGQDQDQDQYIAGAYSGYRRNGKRERSAYNLQFFIFLLVLFVKTYLDWFFVFRN